MANVNDNDTVTITVNGESRVVTVAEMRDTFQTGQALSERESRLNTLENKAAQYDNLERQLLGDPDAFVRTTQGMAAQISGKQYAPVAPVDPSNIPAANGDDLSGEATTMHQGQDIQQVLQRLDAMERINQQRIQDQDKTAMEQQLTSMVGSDPILGRTSSLQTLAKTIGAAVQLSSPNLPMTDVLQQTRALVQEAMTEEATATVNVRQEAQLNNPHVTQQGAPQTAEEVRPTLEDMKSGNILNMIKDRAQAAGLGNLYRED